MNKGHFLFWFSSLYFLHNFYIKQKDMTIKEPLSNFPIAETSNTFLPESNEVNQEDQEQNYLSLKNPLSFTLSEEKIINPTLILTVYDYNTNVSYYNATILNTKKTNFTAGIATKIAFINNETDIENVGKFSPLYNRRWLFYVNSTKAVDMVLQYNFKKFRSITCYGILVNNLTENISEFALTQKLPIIEVYINGSANPNITTFDLKEFDFLNQTHNTFFGLSYIKSTSVYPIPYLGTNVVVCFVTTILLLILWIYRLKVVPEQHVFNLQKVLLFFPCISLLLHITLMCDVFLVLKKKETPNYKIYIETAMITIYSVHRTIIWFIILLVLSGWQITKQQLNRDEMKFFIKVYIFVYIAICLDPILDSSISEIGGIFQFSELKNIILYLILLLIGTIKFRKTLRILKTKISYAAVVSRSYIPSFLLKIKMILFVYVCICLYFAFYIIVLAVNVTAFKKYATQEFKIINYHTIDHIFMIVVMAIFYPRALPEYFTADYGDDGNNNEIEGNLYVSKIPELKKIINNKEFKFDKAEKRELDDCKKNEMPLIVINPIFEQSRRDENNNAIEDDNLDLNFVIDKIFIGEIKKD